MMEIPTETLTKEENLILLERLKNEKENYDEIRNHLIEGNIRLVYSQVFHNFSHVLEDKEDLISIGIIGLMKAVDNFELSRTNYFSSFATRCINNEILMHIRKIKRIHSVKLESFDEVLPSTDTLTLSEVLSSDEDIEFDFQLEEDKKMVWKYLDTIPEKQQIIMKYYFGFMDGICYTQYDIADKVQLSHSYINRVIHAHLKRIPIFLEEGRVSFKEKEKGSKISFLYDYFQGYSKDQVNHAIISLNKEDLKILSSWIQSENKNTFPYQEFILKLKEILEQKEEVPKQEIKIHKKNSIKKKQVVENKTNIPNKSDQNLLISKEIDYSFEESRGLSQKDDSTYSFDSSILEDSFLKEVIWYYLNHSSSVTPKEYFLLIMKFFPFTNHSYSTIELSNFLNISEEETNSILIHSFRKVNEFYSSEIHKVLKK